MKNNRRNKKSNSLSDSDRRFGVILESIDGKIDRLAEGHVANDARSDRLEENFDIAISGLKEEMNYKFNLVFEELHVLRDEQVKRKEFTILEKRVLGLEQKMARQK